MRVRAGCESLERLEKLLMAQVGPLRGAELLHDGSKPFVVDGQSEQSSCYVRRYGVATVLGKPLLLTRFVRIEFMYDWRTGQGTLEIPDTHIDAILRRLPEIISLEATHAGNNDHSHQTEGETNLADTRARGETRHAEQSFRFEA